MNLTTPITITFTKQEVVDCNFNREHNYITVQVDMITNAGLKQRYPLTIDKLKSAAVPEVPAVPAVLDGSGNVITPAIPAVPAIPAKGGQKQRLIVNPSPIGIADIFRVETIDAGTNTAFQNAKQALKQNDEIAALTAAGIADGWLMPGTP